MKIIRFDPRRRPRARASGRPELEKALAGLATAAARVPMTPAVLLSLAAAGALLYHALPRDTRRQLGRALGELIVTAGKRP